jgi:hypothetical protein
MRTEAGMLNLCCQSEQIRHLPSATVLSWAASGRLCLS